MENYKQNKPDIARYGLKLNEQERQTDKAIIFGAGQSLKTINPALKLQRLGVKRLKYNIVAADGAMPYLLKSEICPDLVVSADPHPRLVRFFGDPYMEYKADDDYFRRQNPALNEEKENDSMIQLVNKYAPHIKLALSVGSHPEVVERAIQARFKIYWFVPMLDDPDQAGSITAKVAKETGAPAVITGGNTGALAWIIAHTFLQAKTSALLGIDYSYPPGTLHKRTQYGDSNQTWYEIYNPHTQEVWITDPIFLWYSIVFKKLQEQYGWQTWNCTQGGIVFSPTIKWAKLEKYLND